MTDTSCFSPNWASPPGETISDLLEELELSAAALAGALNCNITRVRGLLAGTILIDAEIAERLAKAVGGTADFWLMRQTQYRDDSKHLQVLATESKAWLRDTPVSDLKKYGWISSQGFDNDLEACLDFFGVCDVREWHAKYDPALRSAAFRTSQTFASKPSAVAAWLRRGEIEAAAVDCREWNLSAFKQTLEEIRALTRKHDPAVFLPELQRRCARVGVVVIVNPAPTGCRASGATRFLADDKALLQLSFRYLTDDHFWFTFFHEAGHLVLHNKKALFVEDPGLESTHEEAEADAFAANILIPAMFQDELASLSLRMAPVIRFAKRVGIAPGIVVGQLQHLKIAKQNQLNFLKRRYRWSEK